MIEGVESLERWKEVVEECTYVKLPRPIRSLIVENTILEAVYIQQLRAVR